MDVMDPYAQAPSDPNADRVLDPYPKSARRVKWAVSWQQKAIARDISPHVLGITYADNISGHADDLSLEVEDRKGLWSGDWRPTYGDEVVARVQFDGWFGFGQPVTDLRLGTFAHDKISFSGPPRTVRLECVSAPLATGLRRRKRTRSWRKLDLKQIAQDIADRAQLTLGFDGDPGPKYQNATQNNKSDLEFLQELCSEVGRTLKVTESTLTIYDERTLDGRPSVGEIDMVGGHVLSWNFDGDDSQRYGSCTASFFNPRTGKTIKGTFPRKGQTIEGLDPNGQTLEVVLPMSDNEEAARRAEALLRNANRFANSGRITTVGDLGLVAGVTFDLTNAFGFDGQYIITRAVHSFGGGYTTTIDVRRCLEGY